MNAAGAKERCFALVGALAVLTLGLAVTGGARAAGLGRLDMQSELGQPLRAEVEVPSVGQDEAATLQVRLAPQSAFREANLDFNPALTRLRLDLGTRRADGTYVVHITSAQPINEPYLDLLLELTWSTGRVLREYTVLLDPPGLKTAPEVVAPVAAQTQPVAPPAAAAPASAAAPEAAPAPATPAPALKLAPIATAPQAAPSAASAPARAKAAPGEAPASTSHRVKPGDTLGRIAADNKPSSVSLDQMLVALLRANPNAFINNNVNLVLAGRTLSIPSESEARAINAAEAHREVIAQSADFDAYRSRIAQVAATAPAPTEPKAALQGKVVAKVQEEGAPPRSGDRLKVANAEAAGSAAAQSADEIQARQRMLTEEQARADALRKTNEKLAKELEAVSKAAALSQQQAGSRESARPADVAGAAVEAKVNAPSRAMNQWGWIASAIVLAVLGFALKRLFDKRKAESAYPEGIFEQTSTA